MKESPCQREKRRGRRWMNKWDTVVALLLKICLGEGDGRRKKRRARLNGREKEKRGREKKTWRIPSA
jgi:hypothetical protein